MELAELSQRMHQFVQSKGWYEADSPRPQQPRNLAISLAVEVGELLELYQWSDSPTPAALAEELADVGLYLLQLASMSGIDLEQAILDKLQRNLGRAWPEA